MADNFQAGNTTKKVATDEVLHSGDTADVQLVKLVSTSGEEGSKVVIDALPALLTTTPETNTPALPVRPVGATFLDCSFHKVGSGLLSDEMTQLALGTGVTVSQASGALVIGGGTTANAEFLARSTESFAGAFQFSASIVASQRIANTNLAFILADLIGSGLTYTINSATSITVTKVGHGFTSANVGQFMFIGALSVAGSVPGRYAIASVPTADTINFTVAGFPASGSGTCTLFGWNHYKLLHTGTVVTNAVFNSQRKGWQNTDVTATIATTNSPGTIEMINAEGSMAYLVDRLRASATTNIATSRASLSESLPPVETQLYVFIWSYNGTTAPASNTNWTISFWRVEDSSKLPVQVAGANHMGSQVGIPVFMASNPTIAGLPVLPAGSNIIGHVRQVSDFSTDVASAALTSTATSATLTPLVQNGVYQFGVAVTAVTGTNPTLDIVVQESDDGGTNWRDVYAFERITSTGYYRSPPLPIRGNRFRFVQTVGGTTPSFTRAIHREQKNGLNAKPFYRLIDRSVNLATASSASSVVNMDGAENVEVILTVGTFGAAATLAVEGSENGVDGWYELGTIGVAAAQTYRLNVQNCRPKFVRTITKSAGAGTVQTQTYIKGY